MKWNLFFMKHNNQGRNELPIMEVRSAIHDDDFFKNNFISLNLTTEQLTRRDPYLRHSRVAYFLELIYAIRLLTVALRNLQV